MAIYGVDGTFGSGKSSFAAYMARQLVGTRCIIWTNMALEKAYIPGVIEFRDDEIMKVFRTINWINDIERDTFSKIAPGHSVPKYDRSKFTRHLVILDEAGAHANQNDWRSFDTDVVQYVNQCRKNFMDIVLVTAKGGQVLTNLRQFVEIWFYIRPLFDFWFFKNIRVVRGQERQEDGRSVVLDSDLIRNDKGDWVLRQKPRDWYETWFYAPAVWRFYDDLRKNVVDDRKYLMADSETVSKYVSSVGLPVSEFHAGMLSDSSLRVLTD